MGAFYTSNASLGAVRVVAFSGRESDATFRIWGTPEQLNKGGQFAPSTPLGVPQPPARRGRASCGSTKLAQHGPTRASPAAVLRYLADMETDRWGEDAAAARLVTGAGENDYV